MHYSTPFAVALLPLIGSINASPIKSQPRQTSGQIEWTNPDGGNLQIFFSDETVNFGTMNPADIINNNIAGTCEDEGVCIQGTNDVGTTQYVSGPGLEDEDISYTAEGQYPSWIHNGIISMMAAVMQNQTTVNNACYTPAADGSCGTFESYCPRTFEPMAIHVNSANLATESFSPVCQDEYTAPVYIGAVLPEGSETPGSMQVQFTVQQESATGLCSDMTTIGGVLAGLIPDIGGAAAGIFTLAGLGCH